MSGSIEENIVEIYGTKILTRAQLRTLDEVDETKPYFEVRVRRFMRSIFRRDGSPDKLIEQSIVGDGWYLHGDSLQRHVRCPISGFLQLSMHGQRLRESYMILTCLLLIGIVLLTLYVKGRLTARTREPFGVVGDVAYGTLTIFPESEWGPGSWDQSTQNVDERSVQDSCVICTDDFEYQYSEALIELPFGHVFHKDCIFPWLWRNRVHNDLDNGYVARCAICTVSID